MSKDLLSDVLSTLQVTGSLLLSEPYRSPWGIALPDSAGLAKLFGIPNGTQAIAFHLVREGYIDIDLDARVHRFEQGEVAILFGGGVHTMFQGNCEPLVLSEYLSAHAAKDSATNVAHFQPTANVVCGAFIIRHTQLNPLFASLPSIAHLRACDSQDESSANWMNIVTNRLTSELERNEPGADFVVSRLLELLCANAMRHYLRSPVVDRHGWFAALNDQQLQKALEAFHKAPATAWSVQRLAACCHMSRSRFSERFVQMLGVPPMHYVTRWRMNIALRALKDTQRAIQLIASDVGYENQAAFTRAFKRHVGFAPRQVRNLNSA